MRRFHLFSAVAALVVTGVSCKETTPIADAGVTLLGEGTEFVSYHSEVPLSPVEISSLLSGMFGSAAKSGKFLTQHEVAKAFYVTSQAEPATPDQVRLTFAFHDGSDTPRVLAAAPASYALGKVFITTIEAAIAKLQADVAKHEEQGEIFHLTYQMTSTQGGSVEVTVHGVEGVYSFSLDVTSPRTSVMAAHLGQAASADGPYDLLKGTVWFDMQKDEFDFFTNHAYGSGATSGQNFVDFSLVPYDWLRLTVTPQLDANFVDVGFEVVDASGARIPLAKAPASVMAGSTFQNLVDRQMINMTAQEEAKAGSSTPWEVPFFYEQPNGGGVVQVIAQGRKGRFRIAYSVASPRHPLVEVPFVPYKEVIIPPADPEAKKACYQRGLDGVVQAREGVFEVTFTLSEVIKRNLKPDQKLVGDIGCSIFYQSDVTVIGPKANAQSVDDFTVRQADMLSATAPKFTTTKNLVNGEYQILCAQYLDGDTDTVKAGYPVTLPIGGYVLACNVNPVTVEFALLNPSDR